MMHAIKTTHAVPKRLAALRLVNFGSTLTCSYCSQTVGSYRTPAERSILEARHACQDKLLASRPLAALPFN